MKSRRLWSSDFRTPPNDPQPLYDAAFDAVLIEQSLATQYGILPAAQAELPYPEWAKLVGGLMDNTPLGRVVAVRGETDRKKLAAMGPWAQRIHQQWQAHLARRKLRRPQPCAARWTAWKLPWQNCLEVNPDAGGNQCRHDLF